MQRVNINFYLLYIFPLCFIDFLTGINFPSSQITDPSTSRYEVPVPLDLPLAGSSSPLYSVNQPAQNDLFDLTITRVATGTNM